MIGIAVEIGIMAPIEKPDRYFIPAQNEEEALLGLSPAGAWQKSTTPPTLNPPLVAPAIS